MTGKWIWLTNEIKRNDYAEFKIPFKYEKGNVTLNLSAHSEYVVYVNGKYVYSLQYADYPWYKVYDSLNITDYLINDLNEIVIWVWYQGDENLCQYIQTPGLIFDLNVDNKCVLSSSNKTLSRRLNLFNTDNNHLITMQLGYSFHMDNTSKEEVYHDSYELDILDRTYHLRENKRLIVKDNSLGKLIYNDKKSMVFDLEKETVGFFFIDCISKGINTIKVSFGEYLINNHVQRIIHSRDFSFDLTLKDGNNSLTNYLRKLGLRYLEVEYNENIVINKIGLIPIEYPFNVRSKTLDDNLDNMIYQTSIRTLILNAFDHYTDCPWREQGFYALDSYLQMKYHYLCFDNFEYQRTCLKLLSQDRSNSGLTSLTYPTSCKLVIPSFSLYYIISMEEYAAKTNDYTLIKDYYTKLLSVLNVFIDNMKDGLLQNFKGNNYWNFYEWNESLDGVSVQCDAALNLNFVLALNAMLKICSYLDKAEDYLYFESLRNNIKTNINKVFLNKETNLYETYKGVNTSELVLSYAIISNTCPESLQAFLASELMSEKHIPCTLSMLYFKYEALIKVNKKNITYVINDIRKKYGYMLTLDATSFFETIKGKDDFDGAGSLCHGWSALPIYFYKLFEEIKEK